MSENWPLVSLRQACELVQYGYTASASRDAIGPKFLRITDIASSHLDWDGVPHCPISKAEHDKFRLIDGDIVVARTGATVGHAKTLKNPPDAVFASYLVRFRTYKTVDARFVGSIVESGHFKEWVKSQAGGSAQPNANAQVLASFCFPLPPFDLQRRIASILGAYDDLIEVNRRRVAVLEAMARGLFEEWFVRFRFPGHENHKIIDTPNGPLPEGWTWGTFGALVNDIRDAVDPASVPTETRYVGLEHIPRRSTTLDSFGRADEVGSLKLRFQRGDVLFGKIRPYFHKVAWAPCDGVASSDAIVIRSRREEYAALALSVASSDAFVAQSVQASNGTKMPRANWRDMQSYRVPAAPLDTLTHFDGVALPMIELAASIQAASVVLAASRDLLLPRLISGELSVATAERELEAAA